MREVAAYLGNCGGAAWCYIEGVGERIIFGGEDGFIIKENFEFVKNGKKDGQKGQVEDFRYVKHKEFWFDFLGGVWYSIDAQESRKEVKAMKKIWNIDGNEFFVRENAKEFLAMTWAKDPEKYLCNEDIMYYFNEYLEDSCLDYWLLKLPKATEKQLKEMQNTFKQFISDFIDKAAEGTVDDWLVEEE